MGTVVKGIDFARWIAGRRPQGFYAFCGAEVQLRDEAIAALKERLAGDAGAPGGTRYAVESCQVGETPVQEIAAIACQGGLFGAERLVLIDGLERLTRVRKDSEREAWLALVRGPAANTVVLMSVQGSRELSGRSTFLSRLLAAVQVVEFWSLFPRDAARWVIARARREGLELGPDAAAYLIEHLGTELGVLAREVERIALLHGAGRLAVGELRELVRSGVLGSSWECVEALVRGDAVGAIDRLQGVRREEASFSFTWKLTTAARAALLGQERAYGPGAGGPWKGRGGVTASTAGVDKGDLARLLLECYYWERRVKQGRWLGAHDFIGLEALAATHALRSASPGHAAGPRGREAQRG